MSAVSPTQAGAEGDTHPPALLIRDCALLAPAEPGGLLLHQDILVVGTRIAAIGPTGTLAGETGTLQIVSGEGRLAIPGLINAHTHSPENILKATSPSLPLELWLIPLFANSVSWSPRLTYLSALLGAAEMLKTGTTAVLDHLWTVEGVAGEYLDEAMRAYQDSGIRVGVAPSIEDQDLVLEAGTRAGLEFPEHLFTNRFALWPPIDEQLDNLGRFLETWHNRAEGRLRCLPGPSGIHWCSSELLERCLELAERFHTGLHLHAVETALQAHAIHSLLGKGGITFLKEEGILRPGTSLAHTIWLDPGDLDLLAETGATVVHNPVSNLRLGSGRFPLIEARKRGVWVALGSDGSASNDTQNMFGVLKLTGLVHNQPDEDYQDWPAATEILSLATAGGAAALGLQDELGRLAPGQLADIVLLDLNTDPFIPLRDPALQLVYCETGHSVDTVIVNGQVVVRHGILTLFDEQSLRAELATYCRAAWPSFSSSLEADPATRELLEVLGRLRRSLMPTPVKL